MNAGDFSFERFTDVDKSFSPRVTIRQNGQLGFNEGARNKFNIGDFGYAVLFFDRLNSAVGVLLTNDKDEPGALRVVNTRQNTFVPAKSFLDRYEISYGKSRRFWLEQHDVMLVFELEKPLGTKDS